MAMTTCPDCAGTGDCTECGGTGKVGGVTCPECEGTGDCPECDGEGEMEEEGEGNVSVVVVVNEARSLARKRFTSHEARSLRYKSLEARGQVRRR